MSELVARHHSEILRIKSLSPETIARKLEEVKKSFIGIPIFETRSREGMRPYPYSFFPLTDGPISPALIGDMADLLVHQGNFEGVKTLLTEGDRGGPFVTQAVADRTGIDIVPSNWHREMVNLQGVVCVEAKVGFSGAGYILIYGIEAGQKIIFIDELLSTGGTAIAHFRAIRKAGAHIDQAFFVGEKVSEHGRENITREFPGIQITTLVRFISDIKNSVTIEAD